MVGKEEEKKLEECSVSNMQYYYEPGSGRRFMSTKEVDRYLNGEPSNSFRSKDGMILPFKRVTNGEESRLCWHFWLEYEAYCNIKAAKVLIKADHPGKIMLYISYVRVDAQ